MTTSLRVYQLAESTDESFPRLMTGHPRNRQVNWERFWAYARIGPAVDDGSSFDIFIKTTRHIDSIRLGGGPFAVSDPVRAVLEPMLGGQVICRPFALNGHPFWLLIVDNVIDALDLEHTQIYHSRSGAKTLQNPAWRADRLSGPAMFRIPDYPHLTWATSPVVEAFQSHGFNGLFFWPRGEVI